MHKNTGSGFDAAATDWTLPMYGLDAYEEPVLKSMATSTSWQFSPPTS